MPFVPLDPEESWVKEPCRSREHDPPSHMVIMEPMKWVCPSCGVSVILRPTTVTCSADEEATVQPHPKRLSEEMLRLLRNAPKLVNEWVLPRKP